MESKTLIDNNNPYKLEFTNGLPPGTDTYEQLEKSPRLPRPAPPQKRPTPDWPPVEQRKGKWIAEYLDELDPETEYDQIIRTATFFGATDFTTALGYAAVFCILTQTPAGATATHGGKVTRRGHQRYYETQLYNLHWVHHGSTHPETIKYVEQINKIHAGIWRRYPGAYSFAWEAQMAIISLSYFETWVRKTVGARKKEVHPQVQAAFPAWGERLAGHFASEPGCPSGSFGINYPRNWEELERFFYWFDEFPFEEQLTPEYKRKGHETSESFINQFCELWFPHGLKFVGRNFLLTFVPPNCRRRQAIGDPNPIISGIAKLAMKLAIDFGDAFGSDPVEPPMFAFRQQLLNSDLTRMDALVAGRRKDQDRLLMVAISIILLAALAAAYRYVKF